MSRLFLFLSLVSFFSCISCTKNNISYTYYGYHVEKCIESTFSSKCISRRGGVDFTTDLPVYLQQKPNRIADASLSFNLFNRPGILEMDSFARKICVDLDINSKQTNESESKNPNNSNNYNNHNNKISDVVYYEFIENNSFGIAFTSKMNVYCSR